MVDLPGSSPPWPIEYRGWYIYVSDYEDTGYAFEASREGASHASIHAHSVEACKMKIDYTLKWEEKRRSFDG